MSSRQIVWCTKCIRSVCIMCCKLKLVHQIGELSVKSVDVVRSAALDNIILACLCTMPTSWRRGSNVLPADELQ